MAENEDMALARIYSDLGVTPSQIEDELLSARLRELQDQELTRYERGVQPGVRGARNFLYRTAGFKKHLFPTLGVFSPVCLLGKRAGLTLHKLGEMRSWAVSKICQTPQQPAPTKRKSKQPHLQKTWRTKPTNARPTRRVN